MQTKEGFNFHGMLRKIQHIGCIINLLPNVDSEPNPMLDKKNFKIFIRIGDVKRYNLCIRIRFYQVWHFRQLSIR